MEGKKTEARKRLEALLATPQMGWELAQRAAGALAQLGQWERAREVLERTLKVDPENPLAYARLAEIHFKAKRWEPVVAAATESLSLLYFQPALHALLGKALMETGRFAEAETELKVALAQHPRHAPAHEALGRLYRHHLHRPMDAFEHEGKARSLRLETAARRRARRAVPAASETTGTSEPPAAPDFATQVTAPFGPAVDQEKIITVVSGLPRSGTSMMMQLLAAGGVEPLTDGKRAADADNPLGYFEFEKALELAKDSSWISQARGKAVKIVAQLLPCLPPGEHYHVVFMHRNLTEILASQKTMLERQGRTGAALAEGQLMSTYQAQVRRVRDHLSRCSQVRLLVVDYAALLADPEAGIAQVAEFLDQPFNVKAAKAAVRPDLRRQKTSENKTPE
jgi:tetratricopeptide (TPR) repeat protein